MTPIAFNPSLDLELERVVDVPRHLVWQAWTTPDLLMQWFTPAPWRTVDCAIDLRPGGRFFTVMQSPEGQQYPNEGCYLEVVPQERLVWTDALQAGFRPAHRGYLTEDDGFYVTAVIELQDLGGGRTRYTARVLHRDEGSRQKHAEMGFSEGWGAALDQLVALCKGME